VHLRANFEPKTLPDELISGLGERWEIHDIRVKLHAAMAALHATIDCVETLQRAHRDLFEEKNLGNIDKIVTKHGKAAYEHGGWIASPDKPMTSTAAQMSIQYAAAAQLLDREVLMAQYGAEKLNRPQIRELMTKVHPQHEPAFDSSKDMGFKTTVIVYFKDSNGPLEETVDAPKGISPPASNQDIVEKWRNLVRDVLDDERRERIEQAVLGLEKLDNVKSLIELLRADVKCPIDV
jgi:aconitate decarboxylase